LFLLLVDELDEHPLFELVSDGSNEDELLELLNLPDTRIHQLLGSFSSFSFGEESEYSTSNSIIPFVKVQDML
jgi:hypothetical protein